MKRSLFNSWIQALRSGDYSQTIETLRNPDGFCCLGVLGDIHPDTYWENDDADHGLKQPFTIDNDIEYAYDAGELADRFLTEIDLPPQTHKTLAKMNDGGANFEEIASYLESIASTDALPIEEDI